MRHKGRSAQVAPSVAFRTFGDIRPLLNRFVLPVYAGLGSPPREILCDSMEAALGLKERLTEADRIEYEDRQFNVPSP